MCMHGHTHEYVNTKLHLQKLLGRFVIIIRISKLERSLCGNYIICMFFQLLQIVLSSLLLEFFLTIVAMIDRGALLSLD